jgi:hypothetical protein
MPSSFAVSRQSASPWLTSRSSPSRTLRDVRRVGVRQKVLDAQHQHVAHVHAQGDRTRALAVLETHGPGGQTAATGLGAKPSAAIFGVDGFGAGHGFGHVTAKGKYGAVGIERAEAVVDEDLL